MVLKLRAVFKLRRHAAKVMPRLLWRFWLRSEVAVSWPRGWTRIDHLGVQVESSDPNDHYRPWLEQHVGRQGWAWDWQVGTSSKLKFDHDTIRVKFRDPKMASWFSLVWG